MSKQQEWQQRFFARDPIARDFFARMEKHAGVLPSDVDMASLVPIARARDGGWSPATLPGAEDYFERRAAYESATGDVCPTSFSAAPPPAPKPAPVPIVPAKAPALAATTTAPAFVSTPVPLMSKTVDLLTAAYLNEAEKRQAAATNADKPVSEARRRELLQMSGVGQSVLTKLEEDTAAWAKKQNSKPGA